MPIHFGVAIKYEFDTDCNLLKHRKNIFESSEALVIFAYVLMMSGTQGEKEMSATVTEIIGRNIRKLREEFKMSQNDLALKVNIARPAISNWENGKSEPSSSQLVKLSKIFAVSTDEIVGNTSDTKSIAVVDTSALIKRPSIVEELSSYFDEIIIPEVVISELNNLKDHGNSSIKQRAWLLMKSINDKGDTFLISPNIDNTGKNDEKIANIAKQRAKNRPFDEVYVLSDDIWFQFLTKHQKNLQSLTPIEYAEKFLYSGKSYDPIKSIEFASLVKSKNINMVKQYDISDVDVNLASPDNGITPLISAIRNRDLPMLKHFLSLKVIDLDVKDKHKYEFSAVHHATQLKNMEMIKLLVEAGADFDLGSTGKNKGNTPLMVASWSGFYEAVDYFLSQGACANQQDSNGFTPLIKASIKHDFKIIKRLISETDLNIRSRENKKAIEYIASDRKNSTEIVALFKEVVGDR